MSAFDYGEKRPDGQFERHPSLPPAKRTEFVRPVRCSYRHVGKRPATPLRPLTEQERERFGIEWAGFEDYGPGRPNGATGRLWTDRELSSGCGEITTMGMALAETYAADPSYYGSTFCARCRDYYQVGEAGEFVWIEPDGRDGPRVGT